MTVLQYYQENEIVELRLEASVLNAMVKVGEAQQINMKMCFWEGYSGKLI